MGIIYLVQPEELVGTNRWKIGCSKRHDLKRVTHGYKKGTRPLCIVECKEPHQVERQLVKFLDKKYKKVGTSEYYIAFEDEIRISFMNFVLKEYKKEEEVVGAFEDDFKDDWDNECEYDWKEYEDDSGNDLGGNWEDDDLSSLSSSSEFSDDDDDKKNRKAKPQQKEKKKTIKTTKTTKTRQQNLQVSVEVNVNNNNIETDNNECIKKKRCRMKKTSNKDN